MKASGDKVTLTWKYYYPILKLRLGPRGITVSLLSQTKSSVNLERSYNTMVGLIDGMRAASYGTKRATERAGGPLTSCNFGRILLTPPYGPAIGMVPQYGQVVKLCKRGTL